MTQVVVMVGVLTGLGMATLAWRETLSVWRAVLHGLVAAAIGALVGHLVSPLFPQPDEQPPAPSPFTVALVAGGAAVVAVFVVLGVVRRRRRTRAARCQVERFRALWEPLADKIATQEAHYGEYVATVQVLVKSAEQELAAHNTLAALAALRRAAIRMAIALRPLVRTHPDEPSLTEALTMTLAFRDALTDPTVRHAELAAA